jgi:hypothetical protein
VQYLAATGIGVFVRGERGEKDEDTKATLAPHLDYLSRQLGSHLVNLNEPKAFFHSRKAADTKDETKWDEIADWLHVTANGYQLVIQRVFSGRI